LHLFKIDLYLIYVHLSKIKHMTHGGKRDGAGRPKGRNQWGEPTQPLRIPQSQLEAVKQFLAKGTQYCPLYSSRVQAGFPSPADDYIEAHLDLNEHLIKHPAATFFVKAEGDSMIGAHIQSGDLLIVDRSLTPTHGKIVIAAIQGELTVKRLYQQQGKVQLIPENPNYPIIDVTESSELVIWGVVTHIIHQAGTT
jgi:DNA polymerase V